MKNRKMRCYENLMHIKFSIKDKEKVYSYFNAYYNLLRIKKKDVKKHIYSKVLLRFTSEDDLFDAENDVFKKKNAYCVDSEENKFEITLYSESDMCFRNCIELLKDYDCEIYQFIYDQN